MTCKKVENFQTSLNLQQTYSVALGSHINNIYHKILEIQQQLPHPTQHMNTGDVIQIDTPAFDPDIDGRPPMKEHREIQGSDSSINIFWENLRKAKPLPYHNKLQKKWIGWMQYQLRSHHNQPRITTTTHLHHQHDTRQIIVKYLN